MTNGQSGGPGHQVTTVVAFFGEVKVCFILQTLREIVTPRRIDTSTLLFGLCEEHICIKEKNISTDISSQRYYPKNLHTDIYKTPPYLAKTSQAAIQKNLT
jgi:hypothetical protein